MCAVNGIAMIWSTRSLLPSRLDVVVCRLPCVGRQHAVCVGQVCRRAGWAGPQRRAVSNRNLQRIFTVSTHTPRPIPKRGKFHPCFFRRARFGRRGRFASRSVMSHVVASMTVRELRQAIEDGGLSSRAIGVTEKAELRELAALALQLPKSASKDHAAKVII